MNERTERETRPVSNNGFCSKLQEESDVQAVARHTPATVCLHSAVLKKPKGKLIFANMMLIEGLFFIRRVLVSNPSRHTGYPYGVLA